MEPMTGVERVTRQLKHQSVDRIAAYESFWNFTCKNWAAAGKMREGEDPVEHFDLDLSMSWPFRMAIHPEVEPKLVAEDADTTTWLDGNGATMRRYKSHDTTPEHIGFSIVTREDWEEKGKPFLTFSRNRINFEAYREAKRKAAAANRFFVWGGVNVFELMHPICGHENMLMGMALDPDWIRDMCDTYTNLTLALQEELFAAEGEPDGIWYFEDMGFRGRPFMSPEMYMELIQPAHRRTCAFAHGRKLPVIMHSCGFVEPLLPGMVEAGIDCLQAMEVKAGMDLLRIDRNFGEKIALMGGLDVRPVAANDREGIRRELESKIPIVKKHLGYILHTDHSIPESTDYETYRYFLDLGRELGTGRV